MKPLGSLFSPEIQQTSIYCCLQSEKVSLTLAGLLQKTLNNYKMLSPGPALLEEILQRILWFDILSFIYFQDICEICEWKYSKIIKIPFIVLLGNFSFTQIPPRGLFILGATPLQKGTPCVIHKIEYTHKKDIW